MLNVVMLSYNRPRLTRQALESLRGNTRGAYTLTLVDDGSQQGAIDMLDETLQQIQCGSVWHFPHNTGPGFARNHGITNTAANLGKRGLLYLCDNDCYFLPGWDATLLQAWESVRGRFKGPLAIGGYCHPFQQRGALISDPRAIGEHSVRELEALGLLSWLMEWETWDKYGPLEPSPTINGSEDWALSQRIRRDDGKVGVIEPAVVINTGATGSDGKPCPGAATLWEQEIPAGVIVE